MLNGFRSHVRQKHRDDSYDVMRNLFYTIWRSLRSDHLDRGHFRAPSLSLSLSRARARAHRREIIEKNYGTWISAERHALPRRNFPAEVRRNEIRRAHVRARIAEISERGTSQACSRFIGARISSRNFQFSSKFTISVHGVPFIPPLACSIEN